jgi:hypothetical protein
MDYTTLSLPEIGQGLDALARDTQEAFGTLDAAQLNWRPDASRWSVAQCFDHLITANDLMLRAATDARSGASRTVWQRLPILPGVIGRMMVRSMAPGGTRQFKAPAQARPAMSDLPADVVARFVSQQRDAAARVRALDDSTAARTMMTSPFVRVVTYSVLDGWRLVLAHGRRHFEQARRVMEAEGFPRR